jgi:hypothetical protein
VPKEYDVERHGKYSPGSMPFPKKAKAAAKKSKPPAIVIWDDPSEMASPSD